MREIRKLFKVKQFAIFLINSVLVFIWFKDGLLFAGGEEGIPFYNLRKSLLLSSYTWYEPNAGYPVIAFIPYIPSYWFLSVLSGYGIDETILQAFVFLCLLLVGSLSAFYLVSETVGKELKGEMKGSVPFLSGIFYLLNPYSMTQVWGRGLQPQFFAFTLIPLFLFLFIRTINKGSLFYGSLTILSSFLLSPAFAFPAQVVALWLPVLLYLGFYLFTIRTDRKKIFRSFFVSFLLVLGYFFIHAWWILPNIILAEGQYSLILENVEHNLGSLRGVSRQFELPVLIRLMHTGYFYEDLYGAIYSHFSFLLLSWFIPLISLFSISIFKNLKYFKFYLALFVVSLFISLGSNFPTGVFFEWLFSNIPYFQAFRNPYEKFGIVFLSAYTPFFALGTIFLAGKLAGLFQRWGLAIPANGIVISIMVLISGIFVWPMWTGQFAGGIKINPWIKVPEYYKEADEWLSRQDGDFRLLHVPLLPGDGLRYDWPNPYQGLEPSEYLFGPPSIGRNTGVNKHYYNILLERFDSFQPNVFGPDPDISHSTFSSQELYQELEKLNVRYLVLHRDLNESVAGSKSPEETAVFLEKQPKIKKVQTFGELDIYEVDIAERISRIYSPTLEVEYRQYNPTHYEIDIKNAKGGVELYFLESFHPGWEVFIDSRKIDDHYRIFDYANAWRLERTGDYKVVIKYKPQEYASSGMKISEGILLILLVSLGTSLWRKRKN